MLWTMLLACQPDTRAGSEPLGVIVVSLDTVRWDHTSLGGYRHDTTPNLARLAAQPGSVAFQRAYTPAAWSLPAYASLFTGQEVLTHGVGFIRDTLQPATRTLAEAFQAHGYQTRAQCSGPHLVEDQGFGRGFDVYSHTTSALPITTQVTDALHWLEEERDPSAPFFLFIQGYDAHFPYATPAAISEMFDAAAPSRPGGGCAKACGSARKNNGWRCVPQLFQENGTAGLSSDELSHVTAHYDSAVYYADYQLGRLLQGLEEQSLYDRVTLVVLSDHGEGLGEEGRLGHDWDCSEDIFHVPLLIHQPTDAPPAQEDTVVSLSGLAPTLLALAGIDPPVESDGSRFDALLTGTGAPPDGRARSASKQCYTVRDAAWRYTEPWSGADWTPGAPRLRRSGDGEDRIASEPDAAATLAADIAGWPRGMDLNEVNARAGRDNPALQQALQEGGYWNAQPPAGTP